MGIVCLGIIGGAGVFDGGGVRQEVLRIARAEVGVKERTGNNDGPRVEEYLAYTGLKKGNPYCASFVSWCFHKAGYDQPRTAWSPSMFPASRMVKEPKPADVFGVYFPEFKRIAHAGIVAEIKGDWLVGYEGNSNNDGSRNGDGVYQRLRHKRTVSRYADWIILKQ
ncbi:peptidoglycan-binding protein [Pedobacter heparinus]|uniref:peptidoglycan-binding protein n=1 Tax=Pedobacter heparinus TaxID=984 RepID=UPI00292D0DF4|nr:peptidoglycan-binding protein [Pedobacter heparinus]